MRPELRLKHVDLKRERNKAGQKLKMYSPLW